jgi:hypothetical protein
VESSNCITNWVDEAISFWTNSGIKLKAGFSLEGIRSFERQLDFQFPPDFVELYQRVNGFEDFDCNNDMFSLWSLERILIEYRNDNDNNYIGFCDYLINSHSIGFFKSEPGVYKSYNQMKPIAKTFRETIELMNINPRLLY